MIQEKSETAGKKSRSGGFFVKYLWGITIVALVLRLVASWEMAHAADGINNVLTPLPTSDLATYMKLGKECAAGNFPETFYYQPYFYAVFLVFCNFISGSAVAVFIVLQALLSSATVFLTGWCGKKVFNEKAGLIAAGLTAVSSSLILYVPFCQNETLQTFHLILLFALTLYSLEKQTWYSWLITGGVAGISILTRGNVWLIIPVIAAGLFITAVKKSIATRRILFYEALFFAALLAVQLPFIIHNSRALGRFSGPSTAANPVLALGNTPEAPAGGRQPGSSAGAMAYPESYHRMMNNTQGEYARSVPQQMWQWFCDDPAAFLELQFRKALLFWDGREIPNNVSLQYDGIGASYILRYLFIGRNHLIFALGAAGILFFLGDAFKKRKTELLMLYGFSAAFYVAVVIFYILSRFKAPVIPFLTIFGGGVLCSWYSMFITAPKERRFITGCRIAIFALLGCFFSCAAYNGYRDMEPAINRWLYPDGIVLDMAGPNIQHFDYGPYPFGGWLFSELKSGTVMVKKFPKIKSANNLRIGIMLASVEAVNVDFSVNGVPYSFSFPDIPPNKSDRRMVIVNVPVVDGLVEVRVVSVAGGKIYAVYDRQRQYNRSALNDQLLSGEWVMRAITPR
ncbi:MAG: glycosyltransferase family 39 protein [Lentisphaeria bacterium]|nr:glycosyltransferase family 39 protein [Lentisphaeria bacterium]